MRFRSYDSLRLFTIVAKHLSFTAAADELSLTKGAVSYQINQLEQELGFSVFIRQNRGASLTEKGHRLWQVAASGFQDIEKEINQLKSEDAQQVTIGMSTYFASRWLSPRLMRFISDHPKIRLRIQPLIDQINFANQDVDLTIRWGDGRWTDIKTELLFDCPAIPTAGMQIADRVEREGVEDVILSQTLLHDRDNSHAWKQWHDAAGLDLSSSRNSLVIPDPNVRVQAVIDGQGVALNDRLIEPEIREGKLFQLSSIELSDYGYYLAYPDEEDLNYAVSAFRDWILSEAE